MADLETNQILLALLAIAVDEREAALPTTPGRAKTELVLHGAGLDNATIGALLNKTPKLVGQTIRRATGAKDNG
jgi:hypothetical protein